MEQRRPRQLALCLSAGVALVMGAPRPAFAFDDGIGIRAYYDFVNAISLGRADDAMAQFAEDAIVIAGALCTPSAPCRGRTNIGNRYVIPLIASGRGAPLRDQRFDGKRLRTVGEVSHVTQGMSQKEQLLGGHVFTFRGGSIGSLIFQADTDVPGATPEQHAVAQQ